MSTSGFGLEPAFAGKIQQLLDACRSDGLDFRISQGLRTPQVQAKYYCQWDRRSPADIQAAADHMLAQNAPWLAAILLGFKDTPRSPHWQTNAMPGAGWHQWGGEAADCYAYRNGQMVENGADPAYKAYADHAQALGLTAGYYFHTKPDAGHVQLRPQGGATDVYTWAQIDAIMKARFSDKPALA